MYKPFDNVGTLSRWLTELDRQPDPSDGFALGRYMLPWQARLPAGSSDALRSLLLASWDPSSAIEQAENLDDSLLRHLLAKDALTSVDAFESYLAQSRGSPDWRLDPSVEAAFANLRGSPNAGLLLPDLAARSVLLPSLRWRRDDRPIILRETTLEATPRKPVLVDPAPDAPIDIAGDGSCPKIVTIDARQPERDVDDAAGLSNALAACLVDESAGSRHELRRRPSFGKRGLLAIAAALAALAIIPAAGLRPLPRAQSAIVVAAQPRPATPIRVVSTSPQAVPAPRMTAERAPAVAPPRVEAQAPPPAKMLVQAPPEKLRIAAAVVGADVGGDDRGAIGSVRRIESPVHESPVHESPTHEAQARPPAARPASIVRAPVSASLSEKTASAATPSTKAGVRQVAKRKPRKTTAGRSTEVASALTLPDALKPH